MSEENGMSAEPAEERPSYLLGMTSWEEQGYYERVAREELTGVGAIVDLGCWLGSTTIPLARGAAANPHLAVRERTIYAYDIFRWSSYMEDSVKGHELEGVYQDGDDFVDEFRRRIAAWADHIEVRPGDLTTIGWHGEPIELLLVDAMKSPALARAILRDFYSCLIPGTSLVVHQDFGHFYQAWIHVIHYRLRDYFEVAVDLPFSSTTSYRCLRPIPPELLDSVWDLKTASDGEIDAAFGFALSHTRTEWKRTHVVSAHVTAYAHKGESGRALAWYSRYVARGIPLDSEIKLIEHLARVGLFLEARPVGLLRRLVRRGRRLLSGQPAPIAFTPNPLSSPISELHPHGMSNEGERAFYEMLARDSITGVGEVVDLGCWIGKTTVALARGMQGNSRPEVRARKVYAYDRFRWEPYMSLAAGEVEDQSHAIGEDFREEFDRNTADWSRFVEVRAGDMRAHGWHGAPIELLLVSAMKSWDLANFILSTFYSRLVPGRSIVIHQDFGRFYESWIHLVQYRLRKYFEPMPDIGAGSAMAFRNTRPIPPELLAERWGFETFDDADVEGAFAASLSLTKDPRKRGQIAAAHVMVYKHRHDADRANETYDRYIIYGFDPNMGLIYSLVELDQLHEWMDVSDEYSPVSGE